MTDREQLLRLARSAKELRDKQKAFFRSGDRCLIAPCRDLEARLDKVLAEILEPQPAKPASLFGDEPDDVEARFAAAEKGGGI